MNKGKIPEIIGYIGMVFAALSALLLIMENKIAFLCLAVTMATFCFGITKDKSL